MFSFFLYLYVMKYIITEEQENKIMDNHDIANKAKMVSKIFNAIYPDYIIDYDESIDHTNLVINDENGEEELMMYWDHRRKQLFVGVHFIEKLYKWLNVPFLDYTEVKTNKRELFDKVFKLFAFEEFGWRPEVVIFHWY